jgi:hypothetical protein
MLAATSYIRRIGTTELTMNPAASSGAGDMA